MHVPNDCWFDHEKLEVYREAIAFIAWLSALLEGTLRMGEVKDDIAHGSALECAAGLDVVAKAKLTPDQIRTGRESLQKIVRMLMGLIKRNSTRAYDKGNAAN